MPRSTLSPEQKLEIIRLHAPPQKRSKASLARQFHVSVWSISEIIYRLAPAQPMRDQEGVLTDFAVDTIRHMCGTTKMTDTQIALRLGVSPAQVHVIRRGRPWDRSAKKYRIDEQSLTVTEIAQRAGTSRTAIQARIRRGLRGAALVAGRHDRAIRAEYPARARDTTLRHPGEHLKDYAARRASEIAYEQGRITRVELADGMTLDIPVERDEEEV